MAGHRKAASRALNRDDAFHACFILNTLIFSQAFFSLFPGVMLIVKPFAGTIDRDAPGTTDDAAAIV
jgi:hypothetical protein